MRLHVSAVFAMVASVAPLRSVSVAVTPASGPSTRAMRVVIEQAFGDDAEDVEVFRALSRRCGSG